MNQERTARRTRKAAAQADKVIAEAVRRVRCRECKAPGTRAEGAAQSTIDHEPQCSRYVRPAQKAAKPTNGRKAPTTAPAPRQGGSVDLAAECKRLREGGMAWWLIGKTLGLPGAGDSATTGKAGAHQARRLYASGNGGQVPRTRAPRGKAAEPKGPGQQGTKTERKVALTLGEHVIPEDMPDEEVVAMLAGRWIEWGVNLADLCPGPDEWYNHEARVHPEYCIVDEEPAKDGSRTLRFREFLGRDQHGNLMSGPTRTVRLRSIHTVRG